VSGRVERLRSELESLGVATFLVTDPTNVRWLTGFASSNAAVIVGRDRTLLLTDGRYIAAARATAGVEAVQSERNLAGYLGDHLAELAEPPVGFEADQLTVSAHDTIAAAGVELVRSERVTKTLRAVKEPGELESVRRAARILVDALLALAKERLTGRTEAEVAWWLERAIHEEGADEVSFDVIVASGPNASVPHHHPGQRLIGPGETVIVDAGARVDGYCSDCTRTFATGALPEELRKAYATTRAAQESALAAVRAGAQARELDAIAREELREAGYDALHGLGHGVGLDIHELPVQNDVSEDVLAAGSVVTVEPGVYLEGRGGVRIEDLVIVTETGGEVLTPLTKDLLELS
jgi:Xaa-Pro aminopeptidase